MDFYQQTDVVALARQLIGKVLVTRFDGKVTSCRIAETEAYNGIVDKASHAYGGRRSNRTKVMYMPGGTAYVYQCYGIHHLFNVVTNLMDEPHAILIRSAEVLDGMDEILTRLGKTILPQNLMKGPGVVSKGLGIFTHHTASSLLDGNIALYDDGYKTDDSKIIATPRIGVDYAAEDALLPYRFIDTRFKQLRK